MHSRVRDAEEQGEAVMLFCVFSRAPPNKCSTVFLVACASGAVKPVDPTAINVMSGKSYEQEFDLEQERMKVSAVSLGWGGSASGQPRISPTVCRHVAARNQRCPAGSNKTAAAANR